MIGIIYFVAGWPNTVFWLENNDGVLEGVLFIANGLAAGAKLLAGWDGLHACWPKRDMLLNADPGELNPKDVWPNEDGWLAAAATDPNNPLDVADVEGVPKIDDVVLVEAGAPKMEEVVVAAEPNIELDEAGTVGLPNIDEFVVAGEPKTVFVWAGDPNPPVVFVVVADPNIEDTVVAGDVPNIDIVVVFNGFPKMDDEVVVLETPKIDDVEVVFVGVPNIDEEVVAIVGVPKIEGALVFVELPNIEETPVVFIEVLKIEEVLVVFVGVLKIEAVLFEFVGVLKIDEAIVVFAGVLKIDVLPVVLFSKMLIGLVAMIGVPNIGVLVDKLSKIGALLVVTVVVGTFSLSGVTGSDIIGVGLSETWEVVSITLLLVVVAGIVLKTGVVLTTPKVDDTVESTASMLIAEEKLKDSVTVAATDVQVKMDLVSGAEVFEMLFLGAVKLNVAKDAVSDFEFKLKVVIVESFSGTVSCLFFNLSSLLRPENTTRFSKGLDVFNGSKPTVVDDGVSILFLIESAKLNVTDTLVFGTVVSVSKVGILLKLKGILSFDSVVPEITSKVAFVETILRVLLKFKGSETDDFKLNSTGTLLEALVEVTLFPYNVVLAELKTTGSLAKT